MQARMKNPGLVIPDAITAIRSLNEAIKQGGVPPGTLDLVHLRASQINGCSVCLGAHPKPRKTARPTNDCSPWSPGGTHHSSPTPNAPHWPSPRPSPGSATGPTRCPTRYRTKQPRHYDEPPLAALVLWIAAVNVFNRVNVAAGRIPANTPAKSERARRRLDLRYQRFQGGVQRWQPDPDCPARRTRRTF